MAKSKKPEYLALECWDVNNFNAKLEEAVNDGWLPVGTLSTSYDQADQVIAYSILLKK